MIFQHTINQVLDGSKTQTRRLVKQGDMAWVDKHNKLALVDGVTISKTAFKRWEVGKDYAVCPGRGRAAEGRIKITGIRRERVQDIIPDDARAEMGSGDNNALYDEYIANNVSDLDVEIGDEWPCWVYRWIWNYIHTKKGERWADNPEVWVLEFELLEENED